MTDARVVLTTAGTREEARKIAQHLIAARLAACVNIVPRMESVYRWAGTVETAQECLLIIKTTSERWPEVRDAIIATHSYELPECILLPVEEGSERYLSWIRDSCRE